jgi:putative endonuclease
MGGPPGPREARPEDKLHDPPIPLSCNRLMAAGFVYILASQPHGTLYLGVTSNLHERMDQHRAGAGSVFVKKYRVTHLVYFEEFPLYVDAIRRETMLKRWKRNWKIALIEKANPEWKDRIENWHR